MAGPRSCVGITALVLFAACGGSRTDHASPTPSSAPETAAATTPIPTTLAPQTTTVAVAPTTARALADPAQVAVNFALAFYTWDHGDFTAGAYSDKLRQRCQPFDTVGLDRLLATFSTGPTHDANRTDYITSLQAIRPTADEGPVNSDRRSRFSVDVLRRTLVPPSQSPIGTDALSVDLVLYATSNGWKVAGVINGSVHLKDPNPPGSA